MLKPFYNKKKNIDDRLLPAVSAADAGKVLGVTEEGKIAPVEGGGGGNTEPYAKGTIQIKLVTESEEDPATADFSANTVIVYTNTTVILIPNAITVTSEYQDVDAYVLGPAYLQSTANGSIVQDGTNYFTVIEEVIENCRTFGYTIVPFNDFKIKCAVMLEK